jgi:hypothetical protein
LPPPLFSSIIGVVEVVVKLILGSEPLHVLIVHGKVLQFTFSTNLDHYSSDNFLYVAKGGVLVPPNLYKLTLVAPSSMRYDL